MTCIYSSYEYATRVRDPCVVKSANIHNNIMRMVKYVVSRPMKSNNYVTAAATLLFNNNS